MAGMAEAPESQSDVTLSINGKDVVVPATDTAAMAALRVAVATRANPATGQDRGPYCMMGVCFECLMEIDGIGGRQACLVPVANGMSIRFAVSRKAAHHA